MRAMDYNLLKGYVLDTAFSVIPDPAAQEPPMAKKIRLNTISNSFAAMKGV